MTALEICFWISATCVVYTYAGYPLLLALLARLCYCPPRPTGRAPRSVSIVLAVHNEEEAIDRRLTELTALLARSGVEGEIIVVSDGSTDGTAAVARAHTKGPVRVLEVAERQGKANALTQGCAAARQEILVFTDVRQTWAPDALRLLLENFADPAIGAASGDLMVEKAPGVLAGVALYWRFEKWLRRNEGRVHSTVGVTGAICAVRRSLFRPIPDGTLLDDVFWPLEVVLQGYRVVHDIRAHAYDRLPDRPSDEFRRKVRTLTGNYQLLTRVPAAFLPWRNPIWAQFVSHKLLRLVVPWALLALAPLSLALPGALYQTAFWLQVIVYSVGLAGLGTPLSSHFRLFSAAGSFLVLNAAAWLAFWKWIFGKTGRLWTKVSYEVPKVSREVSKVERASNAAVPV